MYCLQSSLYNYYLRKKIISELLGMENQLGIIEVGKLADIVAFDGNRLTDAKVFGSCFCDEGWSGL